MHYKFSFNLGDCETRTKNIKGSDGGEEETREEEGCKGGGGDGWMDGIAVPRA